MAVTHSPGLLMPWSYSKLADYEKCPRFAFHRHVEKLPEPPSPYAARGTRIHAELERFVKAKTRNPKPPAGVDMATWGEPLQGLKLRRPLVERYVALDRNWQPTTRARRWVSMRLDVLVKPTAANDGEALVIDHKTGKVYQSHRAQGLLYALATMLTTHARQVLVEFWYLDQGTVSATLVKDSERRALIADFNNRAGAMEGDYTFAPKPGGACRWCPFGASKGGPCKDEDRDA